MAASLFIEPNGSTDTYFTFDTADDFKSAPLNTPMSPGGSSFGSTLSTSPDESDFLRPPYAFPGRSPSTEDFSTSPNSLRFLKTYPPKIARPPNAWILYRSQKLAEFKDLNPDMYTKGTSRNKADRGMRPTQASFSKQIAEMWANEPADVKEYYHNQASLKSMVHAAENPGESLVLAPSDRFTGSHIPSSLQDIASIPTKLVDRKRRASVAYPSRHEVSKPSLSTLSLQLLL
jgi:hypothetical protein